MAVHSRRLGVIPETAPLRAKRKHRLRRSSRRRLDGVEDLGGCPSIRAGVAPGPPSGSRSHSPVGVNGEALAPLLARLVTMPVGL